jgi:hypothetical protein
MAWLVARHRWRATWLWGLIGLAALVNALWIYMEGGVLGSDLEALWIGTSLVLHLLLKLWMAAEAPSQFHEDRRSGAMELMLTTPLHADEIVSGRIAALRRLWTGPVLWVLATDVLQRLLEVGQFFDQRIDVGQRLRLHGEALATGLDHLDVGVLQLLVGTVALLLQVIQRLLDPRHAVDVLEARDRDRRTGGDGGRHAHRNLPGERRRNLLGNNTSTQQHSSMMTSKALARIVQ